MKLEEIKLDIFKSFLQGDPQNSELFLTNFPDKRAQVLHSLTNNRLAQTFDLTYYEEKVRPATKLMIVEDNPDLILLYKKIFQDSPFTIIGCACDGIDAVDLYKELLALTTKPEVILLDYNLPLKNGKEVALEIRCIDADQPIIFVTGNSKLLDRSFSQDHLQSIPIIIKPFNFKALVYKITTILNK